jgi:predicted nuclease of predicted toxin-antitoxin system
MMLKLDECLPVECANLLTARGHGVETVPQEGLQGEPDESIWSAAQKEQRFLVTTDLDFSDIRRYTPGQHCGVLLIRLHDEGKRTLLSYLEWLINEHDVERWKGCLVIATDHKVRVKRPESTRADRESR